jgi:hypothetical protein
MIVAMKVSKEDIRAFFYETIPDYFLDLLPKLWVVLVAVALSIVGAIIDMGDFSVPGWFWLALIAISVFIAQFMLWIEVRNERDALRKYNVTQDALKQIAEYRHQGITFQNEKIKTEEEHGDWWARYKILRKEMIGFISENFSPTESQLFDRLGIFDFFILPGDPEEMTYKYLQRRSWIIRDHKWLDDLAKDYGRKRHRAEIEDDNEQG